MHEDRFGNRPLRDNPRPGNRKFDVLSGLRTKKNHISVPRQVEGPIRLVLSRFHLS